MVSNLSPLYFCIENPRILGAQIPELEPSSQNCQYYCQAKKGIDAKWAEALVYQQVGGVEVL